MIATNIALPQRFDASMQPIDRLHPSKAGYDLNESPLSSASMTLSAETVEQGEFVRMFDTYGAVDVFRIAKVKAKYAKGQREQDVTLEHALATLGDVLIRGYYEFGGTGITTAQVLTTLLALQPVTYWVLGACEYADEYQYSVENESLLNTLLSVASPLTAPYRWTFDTTTFPFMLNLVQASNIPTLEFRMSRNVQSVSHTVDRRDLRTRLYPLGYGEGVNQLTIADVNGGVEYIEANTGTYGVISDTFVDTSVTDAQMLKNTAQAYLDVASEPSVLTEVDGIDVFLRTGEPMDAPRLGAVASVPIAELGIDLAERVIRVVKNDIYGAPHKVKVTLTNQKRDSVRETAALMRKSRIGDLYSQGSISFVPLHFADNADAGNKLACDFYIDAQEININQVLCKFKLEAFRSYSNVSAAGGRPDKDQQFRRRRFRDQRVRRRAIHIQFRLNGGRQERVRNQKLYRRYRGSDRHRRRERKHRKRVPLDGRRKPQYKLGGRRQYRKRLSGRGRRFEQHIRARQPCPPKRHILRGEPFALWIEPLPRRKLPLSRHPEPQPLDRLPHARHHDAHPR